MSAVQSKLTPISATCIEYVHPWTEHCSIATAGLLLQAAQESFRLYSSVYTLSLLMRCRIPTATDLKRMLLGILQSTAFLTTSAFTYSFFLCLLRHYMGSFNFYTVSYVPSFMSSMCALLLERPSRRGLLCLYVSNVATETLFNMACSRGYVRPLPHGQVLIFGAGISLLLYYFRCGMHQGTVPSIQTTPSAQSNKDSIYDILRFVVGRYEEHVPALQLQPQFLSRRRERQSSAPLLSVQRNQQPQQPSSSRLGQSKNPLLPIILQAVRYYTQMMDYFKYGFPRHKTCPHPRNSCLHYVVSGGTKLFTIGLGLQITLILIRLKMTSKQPWLTQLKSIFRSSNTLKLGTFLGGFATIFRLSSCSLRHITGKDDPKHAIPAAFLSSIAFVSYPDTTVALYVFWKAIQCFEETMIHFGEILTILTVFILVTAETGPSHDKVIACYATNETNSNGTGFPIEEVDFNLCTHLIYANNLDVTSYTTGPWRDSPESTNYEQYTNLRDKYSHLKVSLSVKHFLADYLRIASDPGSYWDFAKDASDHLLRHKFDGLDLLWEFSDISDTYLQPNQSFGDYANPNLRFDKEKLHSFVKRLKKSFKLHGLMLTATFVSANDNIIDVLDIPTLCHYFDYVHFVQKYNFNWKPQGDIINYAIKERGLNSTEQMIEHLLERDVPADKLMMGVQFSGMLFRSINGFGRFNAATFRRLLGYNEVCEALSKFSGWQKRYDTKSGLTIANRMESSSGAHLPQLSTILFESGRSIVRKMQFVVKKNLAGAIVFPIDMDDSVGLCPMEKDTYHDFKPPKSVDLNVNGKDNRKFPLLKTLNEAIVTQLEENDEPIGENVEKNSATIGENIHVSSRFGQVPSFVPIRRKVKIPNNRVHILKIRRPIQTVQIPVYDYDYDLSLDLFDSLLAI
ncbi:uncharacterized protein LOC116348020 [Contarinia nasturtii]|uniref:uncharacterized protein LOC116348020 n=1 Tax=Contarinia nasturtii TaxID=265458 RepID=UPI0012D3D1CC|nr:uncharacterized protein LOC116348020 [Contarinia nasturtii]XP_031634730.1 uncharacterized protein LOC116348020 [Contarinia nasturtii]